jgi:hypothetical protein
MAKRLPGALPAIEAYFNDSEERVFGLEALGVILAEQRSRWDIPLNTTRKKFVEFLLEKSKLHHLVVLPSNLDSQGLIF